MVQVIARTTPGGALEVDLVPRSGRYRILFGRLENEERKFSKLDAVLPQGAHEGGMGHLSHH